MKYFTPQDVVEAWQRGEINRFKVRMNRNTARRCGYPEREKCFDDAGNDSNLLIVFYVQIMPDDFVMQLHRF